MKHTMFAFAAIAVATSVPEPLRADEHAPAVTQAASVRSPSAETDWMGGYVGLLVGALWSDEQVTYAPVAGGALSRWSPDANGTSGGLYLGYNWQTQQNLVYGIEAEYSWVKADGSDTLGVAGAPVTRTIDTTIDKTAAIRARIGYAFDRTLLYATAGWAHAKYDSRYSAVIAGAPSRTFYSWSGHADGWTVGFGVEHVLSNRWVARIDYRYSDYGTVDQGTTPAPAANASSEFSTQEVRFGLATRF